MKNVNLLENKILKLVVVFFIFLVYFKVGIFWGVINFGK